MFVEYPEDDPIREMKQSLGGMWCINHRVFEGEIKEDILGKKELKWVERV